MAAIPATKSRSESRRRAALREPEPPTLQSTVRDAIRVAGLGLHEGDERPGTVRPARPLIVDLAPDDLQHIAVAAVVKTSEPAEMRDAICDLRAKFAALVKDRGIAREAFRPLPSPGPGGPLCEQVWECGIPARLIVHYSLQHQGWHVSLDAWHERKDVGHPIGLRQPGRWDLVNELETLREREKSASETAAKCRREAEDLRRDLIARNGEVLALRPRVKALEERAAEAERGKAILSSTIDQAVARKAEAIAAPLRAELVRARAANEDVAGTLAKLDEVRRIIRNNPGAIKSHLVIKLLDAIG